jgi:POT family proton-dependent oligopeptide transporter
MPVPWLQSLDGLAPFVLLPPLLLFWRWQASRDREPDEVAKAAIGCFIFGLGTMLLAGAQFMTDASSRTPLALAVVFHFVSNLGWLFFVPSMNSLYSRLGPASVNVTLGSFASGWTGGIYGRISPLMFWSLHAGLVTLGGVLLFVTTSRLRQRHRLERSPLADALVAPADV